MRSYEIKEEDKYFPSNFTPGLVMDIVLDYMASLPSTTINILIYNYPCADMRKCDNPELHYPRAADEF